jgi:hypothetical protein
MPTGLPQKKKGKKKKKKRKKNSVNEKLKYLFLFHIISSIIYLDGDLAALIPRVCG